jgi:hypothetical protein
MQRMPCDVQEGESIPWLEAFIYYPDPERIRYYFHAKYMVVWFLRL